MSMAFEVTEEDLENVLQRFGKDPKNFEIGDIMDNLDHEKIVAAALMEHELGDQTESAYDEIALQLFEGKHIDMVDLAKAGETRLIGQIRRTQSSSPKP